MALGLAIVMVGLVHVLVAVGLRRGIGVADTAAVVISASMAALFI